MVPAEIKTNIQNIGGSTAAYRRLLFGWCPKWKIYKPVSQYPCKLDPARAVLISVIRKKYSLVRKGPSIISILTFSLLRCIFLPSMHLSFLNVSLSPNQKSSSQNASSNQKGEQSNNVSNLWWILLLLSAQNICKKCP